jgi:hypothetical protein
MFKKPSAQAALQNFKPLEKMITTRYAGDTRLRATLATARHAEARRKEKEKINHRGHRGRREEKKYILRESVCGGTRRRILVILPLRPL